MEPPHAEPRPRVAEEVADQPAQTGHIADPVPVDHVAQDRHVHVVAQQPAARAGIEILSLGESTTRQPLGELRLYPNPLRAAP